MIVFTVSDLIGLGIFALFVVFWLGYAAYDFIVNVFKKDKK